MLARAACPSQIQSFEGAVFGLGGKGRNLDVGCGGPYALREAISGTASTLPTLTGRASSQSSRVYSG
jgi:hypothetical protein